MKKLVLTVLMTACISACDSSTGLSGGWRIGYITAEFGDSYQAMGAVSELTVSAPSSNTGGNTRSVLSVDGPESADEISCVTFTHNLASTQEGVALRIRSSGSTTKAITITKNVWYQANWIYNVHLMDSSWGTPAFKQLAGFDMKGKHVDSGTVRLCARVIGTKVQVKVWPTTRSEPSWTNSYYTNSVRVPQDWVYSGRPGVYAGHILPGVSVRYTGLVN